MVCLMATKLRTDEERQAWLQLRRLTGERDRVADERDQLRRQIMGANASGPAWPGPPPQELRARLQAVTATWSALTEEIRVLHDGGRPPSTISRAPPIIGGILRTSVPTMRIRRR
jgi:hypothetical protein